MEKAVVQRNNFFIYVKDFKNATFNFNIMRTSIPRCLMGLITRQHVQYLPYLTIFINHLKMGNALKKEKKSDRCVVYSSLDLQKFALNCEG